MKTQPAKWDNRLAVGIPKPAAAQLGSGDRLELEVEAPGAVTIPKPQRIPGLRELVRKIIPENHHCEADCQPKGSEVWS